ncbi:siderophore synthetase component [Alkalihalobacillus xiaoxiensis]|uniref:Siderophore synthetase component n=1 Tax=Shouchella xiaoxiensis TaxID=766895 RepID=A0ABS2T1Y7_9BACI|nr:IucA/IucC family protein [Shouchella xiaoxiensis]MBM7840714.1 siderophore synthetase component [Shouchella xiaoxiensis]
MQYSAKCIAENASLQAFLNSYLRETKSGDIVSTRLNKKEKQSKILQSPQMLILQLPRQRTQLRIEVWYESLVGRHTFGTVIKEEEDGSWHQQEPLAVLIMLIQELHLQASKEGNVSCFDECLVRMLESYHSMCTYLEHYLDAEKDVHDPNQLFIEAEQSLLFGHWLHPTPKSRQGMAFWQHAAYAPELSGEFQLYYFFVHHSILQQESILEQSVWEIVTENAELDALDEKWFPFPMHPLQAQFLLDQPHVKEAIRSGLIQDYGPSGESFTATSSLRTVFNQTSSWMYKFSIPVKVTNSLRVNKRHELRAGIFIEKVLNQASWKSETCHLIADPAYATVLLPDLNETGFEMIIRANPFTNGGRGVTTIAALVQDPLPGSDSKLAIIIKQLAQKERRSICAMSEKWFSTYLENAVIPLIMLYDELGIALEAHQQNSLLDVSSGYPAHYYYRDNQGYYLAKSYRRKLMEREPDLRHAEGLFYDDALIEDRFTYYLLLNQIFAVIHRFGVDQLLDESRLLTLLHDRLTTCAQACMGVGKSFIHSVLTKERLAFKANLLTRFHDVDELAEALEQAVYVTIPNPFLNGLQKEVYHGDTVAAT